MASFEILIPPLDDYEQTQEAFDIEPEQLAITGLSMVGNVADRYVKKTLLNENYGYVMPFEWQGERKWLRGLYLHENESYDPVGIPRRPEQLQGHLAWHHAELQRLQQHGFDVVPHLPVIVKDEDRWGEAGYGIFTISDAVEGPSLESSIRSRLQRRQEPALQAIAKLANYYKDPQRPENMPYMRDICYMRQYIGHCLVDLDPLQANSTWPNELAHLTGEASRLRSKEGKALHRDIRKYWESEIDNVISYE